MKGTFDKEYVLNFAKKLLEIDSPTGYCFNAIQFLEKEANQLGYQTSRNEKGNLLIHVNGQQHEKAIGLSAHTDTLGLMVRSIKENGMLAITQLGGPTLPTYDGEYCHIITRDGKTYSGTIICTAASKHVHPDASSAPRDEAHLEVRIDEVVTCKEDVQKLGIQNGDFIAIDPKVHITENGFIKSRFLDDKISAAALFGVLKYLKEHHIKMCIRDSCSNSICQ